MKAPLIIASAAGDSVWPANTLYAVERCLDAAVDGIELDVQLTRDGHVVAVHDYRLSPESVRRAGDWLGEESPPICAMTLAELRSYDVGRVRPGSAEALRSPQRQQCDGLPIPTLADILRVLVASPRRLQLFIELKTSPQRRTESSDPQQLLAAVIEQVRRAAYGADAHVLAFEWQLLRLLRSQAAWMRPVHLVIPPGLQSAIVRTPDGDSPWADGCDPRHFDGSTTRAVQAHGGRCWSPHFKDVNAGSVREARSLGLDIFVWGVEKAADLAAVHALDVDAITVSGPDWRP